MMYLILMRKVCFHRDARTFNLLLWAKYVPIIKTRANVLLQCKANQFADGVSALTDTPREGLFTKNEMDKRALR